MGNTWKNHRAWAIQVKHNKFNIILIASIDVFPMNSSHIQYWGNLNIWHKIPLKFGTNNPTKNGFTQTYSLLFFCHHMSYHSCSASFSNPKFFLVQSTYLLHLTVLREKETKFLIFCLMTRNWPIIILLTTLYIPVCLHLPWKHLKDLCHHLEAEGNKNKTVLFLPI